MELGADRLLEKLPPIGHTGPIAFAGLSNFKAASISRRMTATMQSGLWVLVLPRWVTSRKRIARRPRLVCVLRRLLITRPIAHASVSNVNVYRLWSSKYHRGLTLARSNTNISVLTLIYTMITYSDYSWRELLFKY